MFIKSSQRQTDTRDAAPPLTLHRDLARGRARRSRLFLCASVALAASFAAWLFDLSLAMHLGLVGAGFALGFAWPLGRTEPWALGWIDDQTGLAYRTALEQPQQSQIGAASEDQYGFLRALSTQVERTTRRLEPPAAQPWWLPLLAVALSLAVLPAISLPGGLGGGLGGAGGDAPSPENAPLPAQDDTESEVEDAEASEAPTLEDANQDAPELERTFDAPGEDTSGEGGETGAEEGADSETLERYLESLEAQEDAAPPGDAQRNPFSRRDAQEGEEGAQEGGEGARQDAEPGGRQPDQTQENGGVQEGQQGQGQQEQQEQQGQQGEGEQEAGGEGAAAEPEQTEAPREGEQEAGGGEGTPSEQEQQAEGERPQSAQGESESQQEGQPQVEEGASGQSEGDPSQGESAEGGSAGSQEGEESGSAQNTPEGENANGSGDLPSEATPGSAQRLEGAPQSSPELLEGQRRSGATNTAGETLAPGSNEVTIPNAQTDAQYERAAEEAINEGRIPVEYQDILRDYFR